MTNFVAIPPARHYQWGRVDQWGRWYQPNGPGTPVDQYNDGRIVLIHDVRSALKGYEGWFIDGVRVRIDCNHYSGNDRTQHLKLVVLNTGGKWNIWDYPFNPIGWAEKQPGVTWEAGWNSVISSHEVLSTTQDDVFPVDDYLKVGLGVSHYGAPYTGRGYGWTEITAMSLYRWSITFPGWAEEIIEDKLGKKGAWLSEIGVGWATDIESSKVWWSGPK